MQREPTQRDFDRIVSIIKYIGEGKMDKAKVEIN
jgi:hypothetical protein